MFAVLNSDLHNEWARCFSSTLETRLNYSPSDCFATFPFPPAEDARQSLNEIGERYHTARSHLMHTRGEGLTSIYNRLHHPDDTAPDVTEFRQLRRQLNEAVLAAYGWGHWDGQAVESGFHQTDQGLRFTYPAATRRRILHELLRLNQSQCEADDSPRETRRSRPRKD